MRCEQFVAQTIRRASWLICSVFVLSTSQFLYAQTLPNLDEILKRADQEREKYGREFKNLVATETKKFEVLKNDGTVKERRTVRSIFIIYDLNRSDTSIEFRNVVEVNGKPIADAEVRTQKFFEQLAAAKSQSIERKRLYDEIIRHDLAFIFTGLTQYQSPTLEERIRPYFSFSLDSVEHRDGRQVFRISFQQLRECPFISVNRKPRAANVALSLTYDLGFPDFVELRERLSGVLLIDAVSFQLVREERRMTLFPEGFTDRVTLNENVFEYQPSEFGIMTPETITHVQYFVNLKDRKSLKRGQVRFEYSGFTKPDIQVKSDTAP